MAVSFGIQDAVELQAALLALNVELEQVMAINFGKPHKVDTVSANGANWRIDTSTQATVKRVVQDGETVIPLAAVLSPQDEMTWYRVRIGDEGEGYIREDALARPVPFMPIQEGQINSPWLTADELRQQIVLETQRAAKFREMAAISEALAALLQGALNRAA